MVANGLSKTDKRYVVANWLLELGLESVELIDHYMGEVGGCTWDLTNDARNGAIPSPDVLELAKALAADAAKISREKTREKFVDWTQRFLDQEVMSLDRFYFLHRVARNPALRSVTTWGGVSAGLHIELEKLTAVEDEARAAIREALGAEPTIENLASFLLERGWAQAPANDGADGSRSEDDVRSRNRRNLILSGPPGTGKTWQLLNELGKLRVDNDTGRFVTFHPSYSYEDFVIGLRPATDSEGRVTYAPKPGVFVELCHAAWATPGEPHYLVIDEMNRGNLSRIFGELITLLEPDKRAVFVAEGQEAPSDATLMDPAALPTGAKENVWYRTPTTVPVRLPVKQDDAPDNFYVPSNVHVWGTMNTADRSIAMMDFALRRRFHFAWVGPQFKKRFWADWITTNAPSLEKAATEEVHAARKTFRKLNEGITALKGRDYTIGHSYLMKAVESAKAAADVQSEVGRCLRDDVIPLLLEYFYEDWDSLTRLLGVRKKGGLVVKEEGGRWREAGDAWFRLDAIAVDASTDDNLAALYTKLRDFLAGSAPDPAG